MIYSGPISQHLNENKGSGDKNDVSKEGKKEVNVLSHYLEKLGVGCPVGYNLADYISTVWPCCLLFIY